MRERTRSRDRSIKQRRGTEGTEGTEAKANDTDDECDAAEWDDETEDEKEGELCVAELDGRFAGPMRSESM